jgi:hypothetical protein
MSERWLSVDEIAAHLCFVVSDINALGNTVSFTSEVVIQSDEATGDVNEGNSGFPNGRSK